jgi:phage terminase large subunit-like protein
MQTLSKDEYIQYCWNSARDYCEGVQSGEIVCNENIVLAVQRHELDLLRDDLTWNKEAVAKVFKFFSYLYVDKRVQFRLQPFQAFIILALFGLYYKGTNIRKYLYAFLFIGRKNGKTTFSAALQLYFMLGDGVTFPSSVLVAGSQNQANDTSFRALKEMIKCSPALGSRLEAMQSNRIIFRDRSRYGWCKTVPAIEDRLEGLNPTSCILDELHTYKDAQKFNVIKNALGTKENPMLFLISTAGYGKNSFCAQLVETGRNVLRGISTDDRFFYLLYELEEGDNINDESLWMKANPGLGTILDYRTFKDQFNTNKSIPTLLDDFITKRFNLFLEEQSEWIPSNVVIPTLKRYKEDEFYQIVKDLPCYVGVDLSETRDLTSIVCLWVGNDCFYIRTYFFFVRNENNSLRKGGVNLNEWIKNKYVIECSTPTIDYELVKQTIFEIKKKYNVQGLFYDSWHFNRIVETPDGSKGVWLTSPDGEQQIFCRPVVPGTRSFDAPMRFTESLFYEKRVNIYYNECMKWNFQNILVAKDMNGNMRPDKNKSKDAIDGLIALLNAMYGYLQSNKSSYAKYFNASNT